MANPDKQKKAASAGLLSGCLLAASLSLSLPVNAAEKLQYMPPLAPTLDASSVRQAASGNQGKASNGGNADAEGGAAQQIKRLMRQALERHSQGDLNGAEKLFRQVLTIDPANADADFNLGALAEERHDLHGAVQCYQAAAQASPRDADIRDALSSVQEQLRKQQTAAQTTQEIEGKNQLRKLGGDAAAAYKAGNFEQSIQDLQAIEVQQPNDANVQFALGKAFHGQGDDAHALQFLKRAVLLAPDNQLYIATLRDIEHAPKQAAPQPAAAPQKRSLDDQIAADQEWEDGERRADQNAANGGIQPFTSQGEEQLPRTVGSQYGGLDGSSLNGLGGLSLGPMALGAGLGALGLGLGGLSTGIGGFGAPMGMPMGTPMGMGMGMPMGTPMGMGMGMPMGLGSLYGGTPMYSPYGMSPPIYASPYANPYRGYQGYGGGWGGGWGHGYGRGGWGRR